MNTDKSLGYRLLDETIGIPIEIISNEYNEISAYQDLNNSYHKKSVKNEDLTLLPCDHEQNQGKFTVV